MEKDIISKNEINQIIPFNIDLSMAEQKGLTDSNGCLSDEYCLLYTRYACAFWEYLKGKIDLKSFDDGLSKSELKFIPRKPKNFNIYQKYFSFGCQYIYLRNHFCIERLTEDEIVQLNGFNDDALSGKEANGFIENTFNKVIKLAADAEDADIYIYDMGTGDHAANLCLVFEIATGIEVGNDGKMISAAHEKEKQKYLMKLAPRLAKEIEAIMEMPTEIFVK